MRRAAGREPKHLCSLDLKNKNENLLAFISAAEGFFHLSGTLGFILKRFLNFIQNSFAWPNLFMKKKIFFKMVRGSTLKRFDLSWERFKTLIRVCSDSLRNKFSYCDL